LFSIEMGGCRPPTPAWGLPPPNTRFTFSSFSHAVVRFAVLLFLLSKSAVFSDCERKLVTWSRVKTFLFFISAKKFWTSGRFAPLGPKSFSASLKN
jgi:hypothetical protein